MTARSTDDQAIMGIQHKAPADLWLQYHQVMERQMALSSIRNFIDKVVSEETRMRKEIIEKL